MDPLTPLTLIYDSVTLPIMCKCMYKKSSRNIAHIAQHGFKQGISKFLALNKNVHSCFKRLADRQENKQTGFWLPISRALPSSYTILKDLIGVVDCQNREGNLLFKFARVNRLPKQRR